MSQFTILIEPVKGLEFAIERNTLKWAYQSGSNYFLDYFDAESGTQKSVQITSGCYGDLKSTYNLLELTNQTDTLDAPVAVGQKFVISDANLVLAGYANESLLVPSPALSAWTTGSTGTGSFTLSNSTTAKVFTGVSSSVATNNARINYAWDSTGLAGSAVVTFGSVALDGKAAGTEFSLVLRDESGNALKTFSTAEIATGLSHTVSFSAGVEGLELRATALQTGDNLSGVVITVASIVINQDSGAIESMGNYNTFIEYNFKDYSFSFGVADLIGSLDADSDRIRIGQPFSVNFSAWTRGVEAAISVDTRLSLVEGVPVGEQSAFCITHLNSPQALLVIHWNEDLEDMV